MPQADLICVWAAGFFDGEGCVRIKRDKRSGGVYYQLWVSVGQKARGPLEVLRKRFGGQINFVRATEAWQWSIVSTQAEAMLREIQPYLVLKGPQVELALEFQNDKPRQKTTMDIHRAWREIAEDYYVEMTNLKAVA
jgi:hypothetical protein